MPLAQNPKSNQAPKSKPVHVIRIRSVKASIWKNTTDDGAARYNTTFNRSYKSEEKWHNTESMGHFDLIDLAKVAQLAFDWIAGKTEPGAVDQELDTASAA